MILAIILRRLAARLAVILPFAALLYAPSPALAGPILGSTLAKYAVLGSSDVTCVPTCVIGGNVGSFPTAPTALGTSFSFPSFGSFQPAATATEGTAQTELTAAILAVNAFGPGTTITGGDLDLWQSTHGGSIVPGIYTLPAKDPNLVGTLILDGGGGVNANLSKWYFLASSALITAEGSDVSVVGVGDGSGVGIYWTVGSGGGATLNGDTFTGNVMADGFISSNGGLTLHCGRLLSDTANVTLIGDTISIDTCLSGGSDQGNPNTGAPGPAGVPEPSTLLLLATGLIGVAARMRRARPR